MERRSGCGGACSSPATTRARAELFAQGGRRTRAEVPGGGRDLGGIGHNFELIRRNWRPGIGKPPELMIAGVPAYVDGRMLAITGAAGGNVVNRDRMWQYVEGIHN